MRLENSFEVPAPPERAWALLLDVPRVIPCMPGAQLTEVVDDSNWKATMQVKLGPISLSFATDVKREQADEAARRVRLSARAREVRGRGGGQATIESSLAALDGGTRIDIVTASDLVGRFAECLRAQLVAAPEEAQAAMAESAKPVGGLSLGLRALGRSVSRIFRRLLGRG